MYLNNPSFAASQRLRTQVRKAAKRWGWVGHYLGMYARTGGGRRLWDVLGYTPADLRQHLEAQFVGGMTWSAFMAGDIHIDHIVPKSAFDMETIEDMRACHGLPNLRPMWAQENLSKAAQRIHLI